MIQMGISIALLALLALCPAVVAQDAGTQDSLVITCYNYPTSPPDSFGLVLRVFTDDTLFVVSAAIGYNSPELVATSASQGPLIEGIEGSTFLFQNLPSERYFAVTWIGNYDELMPLGAGVFATVYFKLLDDFRCSTPLEFDTCRIPLGPQTIFFKFGRQPFVPMVAPLLINCIDVASETEQVRTAGQVAAVHPNPFNSGTTIEVQLDRPGPVSITIYDILGRRVRTIVDDIVARGTHQFAWDGTEESGSSAASGVYFAKVSAASMKITRKLVLLR
jgi:hypothetical protein